ncbi:MAG: hypothetical protein WD847_17650 [Pirellulales bacterium]
MARVEVSLEVGGDLTTVEDGVLKPLKMSVVAKLAYDEKLLSAGNAADTVRATRHYDRAEAVIKVEKGGLKPSLREDRNLLVAQVDQGGTTIFSPLGPLTREELDLVDIPANSLLIDSLLPGTAVAVGDHWEHGDRLLAALLGLDAVSQADVASELVAADGQTASIELGGKLHGAIGGVATEIELKGKYSFSFAQRRVTRLGLLIQEKRSVGHVGPGVDVVAKLMMTVAPVRAVGNLSDQTLAGLEVEPHPQATLLEYESPGGKFQLAYDRRWHIMDDRADLLAMRLVDRGELIAQCNVSALPPVEPGKHVTLPKFQADIGRSLSGDFRQIREAAASEAGGLLTYRVVAEGEVAELPMRWHYYLVAGAEGRQVVFAFTVEPGLVERLAGADEMLVSSVQFAPGQAATAARPDRVGQRAGQKVQSR